MGKRGDIVHGVDEASTQEAELVVQWADQMLTQLKLRLIVAKKHPLHDVFISILEQARAALTDDDPQGESSP